MKVHRNQLPTWRQYLQQGKKAALNGLIRVYLTQLVEQHKINASVLSQFHHDFLQLIYTWLHESGIQAHLLFQNEATVVRNMAPPQTVEEMQSLAGEMLHIAMEQTSLIGDGQSVVVQVQQYIKAHYSEEINRDDLAAMVYLNPEYLSRLYKQKTGSSLSAFVLSERIKNAMRMLSQSSRSIGDIAFDVGYPNVSYFSKVFRRETGMSPAGFRAARNP